MRYRNRNTGAEIDVPCVVSGPEWEPLKEPKAKKTKKTSAETKKEPAKNDEKADDGA